MAQEQYTPGTHADLPPPVMHVGVAGWIRKNLFSSPTNVILTILSIYLLYKIVPPIVNWVFLDAVFTDAQHRNECRELGDGACWVIVGARFGQFMYGFYPEHLRWRVNLAFVLMFVALVPVLYDQVPRRKYLLWFSLIYPILAFFMLWGGLGFEEVEIWQIRRIFTDCPDRSYGNCNISAARNCPVVGTSFVNAGCQSSKCLVH